MTARNINKDFQETHKYKHCDRVKSMGYHGILRIRIVIFNIFHLFTKSHEKNIKPTINLLF